MSTLGAVILGAGIGRRLGLGPKAFISYNGATLLDHAVWLMKTAGISRICAVLPPGPDAAGIPQDISVARNPEPDSGPLRSLILGLESLSAAGELERVVVHHVDHPHVELEDLERLIEASLEELPGVSRVIPSWQGQGGHPIVLMSSGLKGVMGPAALQAANLRELLQECGDAEYVDAQSKGVLLNWNTPREMGFVESEEF